MKTPEVTAFFDKATNTISYVVSDPSSSSCAVVDPVLGYDPASGRTSSAPADDLINFIASNDLHVEWILETHVHADHLSSAPILRDRLGGKVGIGYKITEVQNIFASVFDEGEQFLRDGSQFDHLFGDNEQFSIGGLDARALHTPGHTPACMSYLIGDAVFVGDTLFMPDYGTARADFPGGDSRALYHSIQRLYNLDPETRVFLCHDYKAPEREDYLWETTIAEERASNVHVHEGVTEDQFVKLRDERDAQLPVPTLLFPSVQVNMRGGQLPAANEHGKRFLKIPLDEI